MVYVPIPLNRYIECCKKLLLRFLNSDSRRCYSVLLTKKVHTLYTNDPLHVSKVLADKTSGNVTLLQPIRNAFSISYPFFLKYKLPGEISCFIDYNLVLKSSILIHNHVWKKKKAVIAL